MKLTVTVAGVHRYVVRIPNQPIFDEHGSELEGICIESRRLILISPTVQINRREEVLGHEVQHAWEFHVPPPRIEEERCQLFATISQQMREDLERQGGIETLQSLPAESISLPYRAPAERHEAMAPNTFRLTDARECACCSAVTMCGSISNGHVEFHEGLAQYQVLRWFRCDVCDVLTVWREVATSDGRPTGHLVEVPAPRMLRGREAAEWLAERNVADESVVART